MEDIWNLVVYVVRLDVMKTINEGCPRVYTRAVSRIDVGNRTIEVTELSACGPLHRTEEGVFMNKDFVAYTNKADADAAFTKLAVGTIDKLNRYTNGS